MKEKKLKMDIKQLEKIYFEGMKEGLALKPYFQRNIISEGMIKELEDFK